MITKTVSIQLNGKPEEIGEGMTIKELLDLKKINPNMVACELNMQIIRRGNLSETSLKSGDVLEIIQMMGGG